MDLYMSWVFSAAIGLSSGRFLLCWSNGSRVCDRGSQNLPGYPEMQGFCARGHSFRLPGLDIEMCCGSLHTGAVRLGMLFQVLIVLLMCLTHHVHVLKPQRYCRPVVNPGQCDII